MSRPDLSPTALADLEAGSRQDHNARQERHTQMLREATEPLWSDAAALFFAVLVLAVLGACVIWYAFPTPSLSHLEQKK